MSLRNKGFTVIELLVVVTIIVVLMMVAISDFQQTKLQLSLSRVAYKFEQDVINAQNKAFSASQYRDASGTLQSVSGYGAYVDVSNNTQYIIYADKFSGNHQYDQADYVVNAVDFSLTDPGIIIKEINTIPGNTISINYAPPDPRATFTPLPAQNSVSIVFALKSNVSSIKTVNIKATGLIEVK